MIPVYLVNAFTGELFKGNPAGVCLLEHELSEKTMQSIAKEIGYSETSFVLPIADQPDHYQIRWFTPECEVPLCGHGSLASAFALFNHPEDSKDKASLASTVLYFHSKSGVLPVSKKDDYIVLDFPRYHAEKSPKQYPDLIKTLISRDWACPVHQFYQSIKSGYLLLEIDKDILKNLNPDFQAMREIDITPFTSVIVTSAGDEKYDFYSRCFAIWEGIEEDPVTGSAHCLLVDYWHQKNPDKTDFKAYQLSERGGELLLSFNGDRVIISGKAVLFMKGSIEV